MISLDIDDLKTMARSAIKPLADMLFVSCLTLSIDLAPDATHLSFLYPKIKDLVNFLQLALAVKASQFAVKGQSVRAVSVAGHVKRMTPQFAASRSVSGICD